MEVKETKTAITKFTTAKEFAEEFQELLENRQDEGKKIASHPEFADEDVALEFQNFSLRYGENPETLYNINLRIPRNKITAIIGPSGCGKSTLLRAINRMNEEMTTVSTSGTLIVDGKDIHSQDQSKMELRIKVGMVFQKPQPFPRSIYENVAFGPRIHGVNKREQLDEIVLSSLTDVGLMDEVGERLGDHAYGLSGGQQQRLCIARTIAVNPSVILCDEPASALDPKSTYQIEDLLLKLKGDYTVVIVTHNMQQAARISDYCFLMYNGTIVEYGPTAQVFENPTYELTENYISGRFG